MLKSTLRNLIFGLVGAIFVSVVYRSILIVNIEGIINFVTAGCAGFVSGFLLYDTENDPLEFRVRIDQARMIWLCTGVPALVGVILFGVIGLSAGLFGGLFLGCFVVYLIEKYIPTFFHPCNDNTPPLSSPAAVPPTIAADPLLNTTAVTPVPSPTLSGSSISSQKLSPHPDPPATAADLPSAITGFAPPPPSPRRSDTPASQHSSPRLSVSSSASSDPREGSAGSETVNPPPAAPPETRKRRMTF